MTDAPSPTSPSPVESAAATTAEEPRDLVRSAVDDVSAILPGWLADLRAAHRLTGVQVALWHEGEIVAEAAEGAADAPAGIDLLPTHRIRIASHSKMFCALTIMRLREQGLLRLDDTLGERVPDLAGTPVADRTVRDLLSHSAGITRDGADASWWQLERRFPDRDELIAMAKDGAVVSDPGVHLQYSNIGYGLLGLVIEEVTGKTFAEAVAELVLAPVGAGGEDMPIGPDLPAGAPGAEDPHGFAAGHTGLLHGERRVVEQIPTGALAPATGFWATASAIAAFAGEVLTRDALLEPASLREMRRRVWTVAEGRHYGLGLQEGTLHGFHVLAHSGGFPTGLTRTWAAPAEKLSISVLGTSIDAPTSAIAAGILGLLALASGRPAPDAGAHESAGALGGAGNGRERPAPLAEQDGVQIDGREVSAQEVANAVAGTFDCVWGRSRLAVLGGRLFMLDAAALDPAQGALELAVAGVREDPADPETIVVALMPWGDAGYGSWAEPVLARLTAGEGEGADGARTLRCTGLWDTGQLLVPTADFALPERVQAPR